MIERGRQMEFAHDGAIIFNLLIAGMLTLILGAVALVLLQRAILRNMMRTGGDGFTPPADDRPRRPAVAALTFNTEPPAAAARGDSSRLLWRHATAHAIAGLAFAMVATGVVFHFADMEFLPLRTSVVVWAYAWPTVLILGLLVGRDRRVQALIALGYFGVLAVICAVSELRGTPPLPLAGIMVPGFLQPLIIGLLNAAPSAFLLLFLNRTIRSIGPLVLVFVFVLLWAAVAISMMLFDAARDAVITLAVTLDIDGAAILHRRPDRNAGRGLAGLALRRLPA
jgi:hypothetical protein